MALSSLNMDEHGTAELIHDPILVVIDRKPTMRAPKFDKPFAQLALLNQPQRQQVLAALHPAAGLDLQA